MEDLNNVSTFNTFSEIVSAIRAGQKVHWANMAYDVEIWKQGGGEEVVVNCNLNDSAVSLDNSEYDISRCFVV